LVQATRQEEGPDIRRKGLLSIEFWDKMEAGEEARSTEAK
jgi:hypothetical protein